MKIKRLLIFMIIMALTLSVCSCDLSECKVTFYEKSGATTRTVIAGIPISFEPEVPEGYIFAGWYSDEGYKHAVDISKGVSRSITLYAKYEADYDAFSKAVSLSSTAFVAVKCTSYSYTGGLRPQAVSAASGSGVIVRKSGGYYYLVTNHHVIEGEQSLINEYKVTDAYDTEYTAELVASDSSVDLAVLRFAIGKSELASLTVNTDMPDKDEAVAAIGNPQGKHNTLTFGKVRNYSEVELVSSGSDSVGVDFPVLWHSAYMDNGSSGGALVNTKMEIVGINFATGASADDSFSFGFAIPAAKLQEFLDEVFG